MSEVCIEIPFAQFDQLIKEVAIILEKFMDLYHAAQHNKRIAKLLLERITEANSSVNFLRYDDLYSSTQYANLQSLIEVLQKMKSYSKEITQYNTLIKFLRTKTIESQFNELCKDYDTSIDSLNLTLMVDFKANAEREKKILNEEIEDLSKFQKALLESISDTSDKKLDAMNKIIEEVSEVQMTILNISADQEKTSIRSRRKMFGPFQGCPGFCRLLD